MNKPVHIL